MDNVQNCDSYINIPSSQTYRSDMQVITVEFPETIGILIHSHFVLISRLEGYFLLEVLATVYQRTRPYASVGRRCALRWSCCFVLCRCSLYERRIVSEK
jgi:hypothetical protein